MLAMLASFIVCSLAEIEQDSSKRTFQSFSARYPTPYKQSNSTNPLYYSFDYGGEPTSLFRTPLTVARHHLSHGCTAYRPKCVRPSILMMLPEMKQDLFKRTVAVLSACAWPEDMLHGQPSIVSAARAGAHYVQIAAYEGPGRTSSQYKFPNGNYPHTVISSMQLAWLEADLASVNRSRTPWLIVQTHPP